MQARVANRSNQAPVEPRQVLAQLRQAGVLPHEDAAPTRAFFPQRREPAPGQDAGPSGLLGRRDQPSETLLGPAELLWPDSPASLFGARPLGSDPKAAGLRLLWHAPPAHSVSAGQSTLGADLPVTSLRPCPGYLGVESFHRVGARQAPIHGPSLENSVPSRADCSAPACVLQKRPQRAEAIARFHQPRVAGLADQSQAAQFCRDGRAYLPADPQRRRSEPYLGSPYGPLL